MKAIIAQSKVIGNRPKPDAVPNCEESARVLTHVFDQRQAGRGYNCAVTDEACEEVLRICK